jgi:hypothetical protein
VAAVIILLLSAILGWCFLLRRKRRKAVAEDNAPSKFPQPGLRACIAATTQQPLSSHFDAPSDMMSQASYKSPQTGQPQLSASSYTAYTSSGSTPSATSLAGTNPPRAASVSITSSTITPSPPTMTSLRSLPPVPEAHRGSRVNEKPPLGMSQYSVQNPTTVGPRPSSLYAHVVANRVQAQTPNEPVEEGLMSRQMTMRSALPPYSPGGFQHDQGATPLPNSGS